MVHAFAYLVHLSSLDCVFLGLKVVSAFPCNFLDSHGVMGFSYGSALDFRKVLELGEVVSGKLPRVGSGYGLVSRKPSTCVWRQENSSEYGEKIPRHPSLC